MINQELIHNHIDELFELIHNHIDRHNMHAKRVQSLANATHGVRVVAVPKIPH